MGGFCMERRQRRPTPTHTPFPSCPIQFTAALICGGEGEYGSVSIVGDLGEGLMCAYEVCGGYAVRE